VLLIRRTEEAKKLQTCERHNDMANSMSSWLTAEASNMVSKLDENVELSVPPGSLSVPVSQLGTSLDACVTAG